jgi:hypothetical protein
LLYMHDLPCHSSVLKYIPPTNDDFLKRNKRRPSVSPLLHDTQISRELMPGYVALL